MALIQDDHGYAHRTVQGGLFVYEIEHRSAISKGWPQPSSQLGFTSPSLGDLDGDGELEIISASVRDRVYVWRQNGELFPGWPVTLPRNRAGASKQVLVPAAAADLDGDGLPEIVVAEQQGLVATYDRFGRLRVGWPWDVSRQSSFLGGFAIIPLGDGTGGIATGKGLLGGIDPTSVTLLDHLGNPIPGWPRTLSSLTTGSVAAGDLDGDGIPELVVADGLKTWAFHLDGSILPGWPTSPGGVLRPLIADFNDDGLPDVLGSIKTFLTWELRGWEGDGTPLPGLTHRQINEVLPQTPTLGDLNGDGFLDMVLGVQNSASIFSPGKVHAFTLNVPLHPETMHWPTFAHDYSRSSTWEPPTRHLGGRGRTVPGELFMDRPAGRVTLLLDVPAEAPVKAGLAVTALGGVSIPPIPVQLVRSGRLSGPALQGRRLSSGDGARAGRRGRQALPGPGGRLPMPDDPARRKPPSFMAQVDGQAILDAFGRIRPAHPELLLTDDEIRDWLATGVAPAVPDGKTRTLWLTLETPRVGILKLTAHLPLGLRAGPAASTPHR
ncbi:MAG: FG-GAP repeat domain-containing protein [Acidobacteriota bacterium]